MLAMVTFMRIPKKSNKYIWLTVVFGIMTLSCFYPKNYAAVVIMLLMVCTIGLPIAAIVLSLVDYYKYNYRSRKNINNYACIIVVALLFFAQAEYIGYRLLSILL